MLKVKIKKLQDGIYFAPHFGSLTDNGCFMREVYSHLKAQKRVVFQHSFEYQLNRKDVYKQIPEKLNKIYEFTEDTPEKGYFELSIEIMTEETVRKSVKGSSLENVFRQADEWLTEKQEMLTMYADFRQKSIDDNFSGLEGKV